MLREVSRYQRTQPSLKTTFVPFVLEQYTRNSHLPPWAGVVRRGQLSNSDGESVLREVSRYQRTQPSLKTTFVPFVLEQYTRNS